MTRHTLFSSTVVPFRMVFLMWLVFSLEWGLHISFHWLGVKPRTWEGLPGILLAPLVHGDLLHLLSNTVPLLLLGAALYYFYPYVAGRVYAYCYLLPGALVWLFSPRVSYHVGASGLLYGLAAFLICIGILRFELFSLLLSAAVFVLYGGIFYGVLPLWPGVSWESHLAGALVGIFAALDVRNVRRL